MSNEPEFDPPWDRTEDAAGSSVSAREKAQLDRLRVELPEKIGRYEVISLLGRGAMGSVHLALDTQLGRQVALKVLSGTARSYKDGRERFSREAQAAAALNHPGICSIYSIEQMDDTLVLVLEYIGGKSFKELLDDRASGWPPQPEVAAGYILQAAEALGAAHAAGIVHRDVKCSNLMLTPDGRVKILDFGVAQIGGSSVLTQGAMVGTPAYVSPEQAQGETVDARSDLWSLGVVFYELLTGRLPFAEDSINALTQAILLREPVPVRQIRPNTPAPLAWVIQKLLAKKRDQRYPSAAALMAELAPLAGLGENHGGARGFGGGASSLTESRSGMASLLGTSERRAVTFLCVELAAAQLSAEMEEWEAALEQSRELCARVVAQHDGYAQPWIGNSVTICFGFPRAREGAAQSAVNAGLALAEVFGRSNTGFHFRGGIETSLVIADTSLAKPLSGEGFELARALCERAGENQVYVGAETRRQVEGRFAFGIEEELAWRRGRTLRMARALHASTARSRFQASPAALLTPLLGRDQEMQILMRHWGNAVEGQGSVILLGGAAGLGKSRLSYELKRRVAENPAAALIECFCGPQYANTALYPIIDCFDRLVFECDTKSMAPEEKLRVLEGVLAQLGFPLPETVPLFASFLGIAAPSYSALDTTPERRRALTLEALASLLVERAARQPLLFIVEDLHWVDPTTLELLRMLVDRVAGAPLFALYTHRPEAVPSLPQRSHVSAISLGRLTRSDSLEMAAAASGGRQLDAGTLEQIAGNSDGVPLFLEEMTKAVVETGGDGGRAGKLRVPATLRESFVARLDQLGSARDVARAAAVLGREFPEPLLEAILGLPAGELKESLERLIEAEILYVRGSGQRRTLIFKHALLQEAAYDSLLRKSRLAVHARAAGLLIHEFAAMAAREPEIVAHHFSEAGLGAEAIPYWHQAGMAALQRSAYREAASQFERGLAVYRSLEAQLREPKQELLLLTSLGPALIATEGFGASAVGETYRRAERLIETAGHSLVLPALWGVWVYSLVRSDLETALGTSRQMIDSGERNSDDAMILEGHWTAGNTLFWRGDLAAARRHLEAAQAMYDAQRFDDHAYRFGQDSLVAALCYLSFVYCYLGLFAEAMEASERSVARARSLRHPFSIGWSLTFRATLECFMGNYREARDWGDESVRYCREQAYPFWISSALAASGRSLAGMGGCEEGIAHLREGIEMTRAIGSRVIEPLFRGELAEALLLRGEAEAALAEAEGAIRQAEEQGVRMSRLDLLRIRGLALRSLGRDGEAEAAMRTCLNESQAASCRLVEITAATHLAEFWRDGEPLTHTLIDFPETANEPPVLRNAREVLRRN